MTRSVCDALSRFPLSIRAVTPVAFMLATVATCAPALLAAPVDPQGVFDTLVQGTSPTPEVDFVFGADASGGGVDSFTNVSGNDWIAMDFIVTQPQGLSITCGPAPFFLTCGTTVTDVPGTDLAQYDIHFAGVPLNSSGAPGISNNESFSFILNDPGPNFLDPQGTGGWVGDADFTVIPTTASPEPASWLLLLVTGVPLAMSAARRRLRP